jgi:polar amino acid transport system permease protein
MQDLQIGAWSDDFLAGLWVTVYVTLICAVAALVLAFVLGLMARTERLFPRTVARVVIEFFRGTSLLVQIFWLYYVLPLLPYPFGFRLDSLLVAVVAFALNFGAYGAEVVRGSLNAVPRPQWEGAIALNLTPFQRMRRVIMPQALPLMMPPFNNLLIQLLKSTPLIFLLGLTDLTYYGDQYRSTLGNELFVFPVLLVGYFLLSYLFTLFMHLLEARSKKRLGQVESVREIVTFRGPQELEDIRA